MSDPFDVPAWISKRVRDWKDKLGLWGWRFHVSMSNTPGGNANADGWCFADVLKTEAWIEYIVGMENDQQGEEILLHEILHAKHAYVDDVVKRVIIKSLPKESRKMARNAYRAAMEPFIQDLAVQLLKLEREAFEAGVKKGKKKARGK